MGKERRNRMDNTLLYAIMIVVSLLMAVLPFAVFLGLGSLFGAGSGDPRILTIYFLGALVISYLTALGTFALVQRQNCGGIKNMKQVASNAGLALGIQAAALVLCFFIPGLRGLVTNLFPLDLDPRIQDSLGYGYYTFWAALFGTAIGGTLSGVCA
jgi:hypothetical protein